MKKRMLSKTEERLKRKCSKCKELLALTEFIPNKTKLFGVGYYCRKCDNVLSRLYYKNNKTKRLNVFKEYYENGKSNKGLMIKRKAREMLSNAIRNKRLTRKPCEVCSEPKAQGHHDDYSKPLEVRWLCVKHHMELHRKSNPLTNLKNK